MKRTTLLLSAVAVLAGLYYFLVHDRLTGTLNVNETDFAIADTAALTQIVLTKSADGEIEEQVILSRTPGGEWMVNGQYVAFQPRVQNLIEVMHLLDVRSTLNEKGKKNARRFIRDRNTRVEAYRGDQLIRMYYVGTHTPDNKGTIMMMDGSDNPYVMERPGFQGYLNVYFDTDLRNWRENLLFDARLAQIKSIELQKTKGGGFHLSRETADGSWQLEGADGPLDESALQAYLGQYSSKVYAESRAWLRYPLKIDTLRLREPDMHFSVEYFDRPPRGFVLYERELGNNYFSWIDGTDELLTVQEFVFGKYIRDSEDFLAPQD